MFVALGGTATAVVTLAPDSVGSAQIQKDAVRSPEIRADAVRSSEIRADARLVQAKFTMRNNGNPQTLGTVCALVQSDTTVLDDVLMESLDVRFRTGSSEVGALTDVVTGVPDDTRVALRCIEGSSEHLVVDDIKITALEVGTVTGP